MKLKESSKDKKMLAILIIIVIIILLIIYTIISNKKAKSKKNENTENENKQTNSIEVHLEENEISMQEQKEIQDLKQDVGMTGEDKIYEVQEDEGKKVVTVKSEIKYRIAYEGMIKKSKPDISKPDENIILNHPKNAGIWIENDSKEKFMKLLKTITNSTYKIGDNGYLSIESKNTQNDNDKKIEQIINGNNLYLISISSTCYIIDDVTGEVLDYCFEDLDQYQQYEYFKDTDKMLIFITENKKNQLDNIEIIKNVLNLI